MRAIHVIAGLDPANGGPSYSAPRLCAALGAAGVEVTLFSVAGAGATEQDEQREGYRLRSFRWDCAQAPVIRGLRMSPGLSRALNEAAPPTEVIHNHGLWLAPNLQAGWAARRAAKPLVIAPRGMLSSVALGFSRLKKQLFWHLLQGSVVRQAACIHATSDAEYREVRTLGLTNPVAVVPNGIDLPPFPLLDFTAETDRVVLYLGRIHPKKGLETLVRAWASVETMYPRWRLRIVGPDEGGHGVELSGLAASLGASRLSIEKPVFGDAKALAYGEAELFVLPTLNENFGMTVAEALAAGIPVISTMGAPWEGLRTEDCGWWIDQGIEPLAATLSQAMAMPAAALKAMGAKGRLWMARDFSWDRVAEDMAQVYGWLTRGNAPPSVVRFD